MGAIDWAILALLAVCVFLGWRKGLAAALINLAGVIAGFFLVGHFYPLVARSLRIKYELSTGLSTLLAVLLITILLAVVVRLVVFALNRVLKALKLSSLNRFAGMLLGFANGLLILICVTLVLDYFPKVSTPLKDSSQHRVYAAVNLLKDELIGSLKLKQHLEYLELKAKALKLPDLPGDKE